MVLRANPVMLDTAAKPPHPAARTSLAAHNRRVRSSAFEAKASPAAESHPGRSC
jgi:hypothetical protein